MGQPAAAGAAVETQPSEEQPAAATADFVVTQELYDKTFGEVEDVVEALNRIIAADDYAQWLTYLTPEYIRVTGSPAFLEDASRSPVLSQKGIVLKTLRDYFDDVVVCSRARAGLDSLDFIDARHVKALTKMGKSVVILYYLVRDTDSWKVGMWQTANSP